MLRETNQKLGEGKLKAKTVHFRLPSASKKRACLRRLERAFRNLVPRSLVDEAEGEIWPNPTCITWSPVRNVTGEASAHAQHKFGAVKADFVAYNKLTTGLRHDWGIFAQISQLHCFHEKNKPKMRSKGFFYNLAGFVFEYFCDSRRILATFAKFCLNSLFATWSYRFTRHPARAHSSSPPSPTQVFWR